MREFIRQILSQRNKRYIIDRGARPSAVLVPIFERGGEDHILFTKRTETVEHHKSQISFPGGRKEEEDEDLLRTALRESYEEIGLDPEMVDILGELDDELTLVSNFIVTPFVGFIPDPRQLRINPVEVEGLLEVPVSSLLNKANYREGIQADGGMTYKAHYFHYGEDVIWGATARILKRFFDLICSARSSL
ncbi:MAG: CoA pyrophosphatase [Dehalococcoidia bacterium]